MQVHSTPTTLRRAVFLHCRQTALLVAIATLHTPFPAAVPGLGTSSSCATQSGVSVVEIGGRTANNSTSALASSSRQRPARTRSTRRIHARCTHSSHLLCARRRCVSITRPHTLRAPKRAPTACSTVVPAAFPGRATQKQPRSATVLRPVLWPVASPLSARPLPHPQ